MEINIAVYQTILFSQLKGPTCIEIFAIQRTTNRWAIYPRDEDLEVAGGLISLVMLEKKYLTSN